MRIGVDLGGHTLTVARVNWTEAPDALPRIDEMVTENTPEGRSVADVIRAMARMITGLSRGHDVTGIGLAIPGLLDLERRHSLRLSNFPLEWDGLDIPEALSHELRTMGCEAPVVIENDANCYALGEGKAGEAVGSDDYAVFTMGTGIGFGVVIGGRLLIGAHGMGAEGGHVVTGGKLPCGCGGIGHAETFAAADGTSKRARAAGLPGDFKELWAMRGNRVADDVLEATLDAMAMAIATACHILDPEMVIIGGGMSRASGIGEALRERALPYLSKPFKGTLDIRISKLGNAAALYGAASLLG